MLKISAVGVESILRHQAFSSVSDRPPSVRTAQLVQQILSLFHALKRLICIFEYDFQIIRYFGVVARVGILLRTLRSLIDSRHRLSLHALLQQGTLCLVGDVGEIVSELLAKDSKCLAVGKEEVLVMGGEGGYKVRLAHLI